MYHSIIYLQGNLREEFLKSITLLSLENTLKKCSISGQQKLDFIPEIVGPFLEMTLIPEIG